MSVQAKVKENRKYRRYPTRLKVYKQENDELLGYGNNISLGGMHIMSKQLIPEDTILNIWFGVEKDGKKLNRIFVSAYRVWQSFTDTDERVYYSGLHFGGADEDVQNKIQELIYELES